MHRHRIDCRAMKRFVTVTPVVAGLVVSLACGSDDSASQASGASASPAAAAAAAPAAGSGSSEPGIVLRVREGGPNPDRFCMPTWSISNETATDVGDLLVQIEWRHRNGTVLQPVGDYGTMVREFKAGMSKDLTLSGHAASCSDVVVAVATYACRDSNAVRMPCPAPFRVEAPGVITADTSGLAEGPMRGAVEPR
jgi:hypothetical protein